jgi:hypothetical protein
MRGDHSRMHSASLASLAAQDGRVHINCHNPGCDYMRARRYGWSMQAEEAVERWGGETTLADIRRRAVCIVCGAREPQVVVECSTPGVKMGLG